MSIPTGYFVLNRSITYGLSNMWVGKSDVWLDKTDGYMNYGTGVYLNPYFGFFVGGPGGGLTMSRVDFSNDGNGIIQRNVAEDWRKMGRTSNLTYGYFGRWNPVSSLILCVLNSLTITRNTIDKRKPKYQQI